MGGSDDALPNDESGAGETGYRGRPRQPDDGRDRDGVAGDGAAGPDESAYELLQRGHALLRDHHNAQAAVVLERAARLERGKGSILEALGRAYFNSGQYARAAETFEALLEVDPSAHYGHFALGLSFVRLGRTPEAKTQLRLAVALDPASETYRRSLEKIDSRGD
jgi:Flp pilus assembly protein TadD